MSFRKHALSVLQAVTEGAESALLRLSRRQLVPHVQATQIAVCVGVRESNITVTAEYSLRLVGPLPNRSIVVDARNTPFVIQGAAWEFGGKRQEIRPPANGSLALLTVPTSEHATDSMRLGFSFAAARIDRQLYGFAFPDDLPTIDGRFGCAAGQARPIVNAKIRAAGMALAGIAFASEPVEESMDLLEAVVAPGSVTGTFGNDSNLVSAALMRSLSDQQRTALNDYSKRTIQFLGDLYGRPSSARVLLKVAQERIGARLLRGGACINIRPEDVNTRGVSESGEVYLPTQLARVWWGGGCRIIGKQALELEGGLAFYGAMRWQAAEGRMEQYNRIRTYLGRVVRGRIVRGFSEHVSRVPISSKIARIALALDDWHGDSPVEADRGIREVTRKEWGKFVLAEELRSALKVLV